MKFQLAISQEFFCAESKSKCLVFRERLTNVPVNYESEFDFLSLRFEKMPKLQKLAYHS